jgi:hypothetical protein
MVASGVASTAAQDQANRAFPLAAPGMAPSNLR